jgi:hypothetical protein
LTLFTIARLGDDVVSQETQELVQLRIVGLCTAGACRNRFATGSLHVIANAIALSAAWSDPRTHFASAGLI